MLWYILVIALLLLLSAAFSGSETALFSLTQSHKDRLSEKRPQVADRITQLLSQPERLLGSLLLSNLVVNTTASAIFTLALIDQARKHNIDPATWLGAGGLFFTGVLLLGGEITPKVLAANYPETLAATLSYLVTVCRQITSPAVALLSKVTSTLAPRSREDNALNEEELQTMIRLGKEKGVLSGREGEILWNLVGLENRAVSEIMTPRIDMVCVEKNSSLRAARELFLRSGFSRLPVYEGTPDQVVGILYAKELLTATDENATVCSICRPAYFVPETKRLLPLLEELRKKGSHIAVVIDQFGQTAGLVTLEDVLEAIIGEIADEYDVPTEALPFQKLDETSYVVDGEIDTATLNRLFDGAFRELRHKRLAAFISEKLGRLAQTGDVVRHQELELIVLEVAGNRLEKVLIRKVIRKE